MFDTIQIWVTEHVASLLRALLIAVSGFALANLLRRALRRGLTPRFGAQIAVLTANIVHNGVVAIALLSVLWEFGFKLNALLTAAGVAGVAIGFAAQTSLSNLISGIFLLGENAFRIGDAVEIDGVTGIVHNIGLLATQLRTFDNRLVRFPNEMLVKTRVTNITRFPVRRLDLPVGVAYKENVDRVTALLLAVADANPLCLDEPAPIVIFNGFGSSAMEFTLAVWFDKRDMLAVRSSLLRDVKACFDREGIEIPFPHVSLCAGETTRPFPVALTRAETATGPDAREDA